MEMSEKLQKKLNDGRQYRDLREIDLWDDEKVVSGYATTFNDPYTLYEDDEVRVMEQVDADAFAGADMDDVIFQYNHEGRVYARRSNNTLTLEADEHGLKVSANLGGTAAGRDLYEEIRGGYTNKMSFGFTVSDDHTDSVESDDNKRTYLRTIAKISKLYDVSAVSLPANGATEISARSFIDGVLEKDRAERLIEEARNRKIHELQLRLKGASNNGN